MGQERMVVLNGFDILKEALVTQGDSLADRPDLPLQTDIAHGLGKTTIDQNRPKAWKFKVLRFFFVCFPLSISGQVSLPVVETSGSSRDALYFRPLDSLDLARSHLNLWSWMNLHIVQKTSEAIKVRAYFTVRLLEWTDSHKFT